MMLLLLAILIPCCQGLMSAESICYGNNLGEKGEAPAEEIVARAGKDLSLECPVPVAINTSMASWFTWFYWRRDENSWREYPWYNASIKSVYFKPGTSNRTLYFRHTLIRGDSGDYTCCFHNEDKSVSSEHQFKVVLIDCYERAVPVILEKQPGIRSVEIGANVTLPPCKAYFGCLGDGLQEASHRNVYWQYNGAKIENGERIHVTQNKSLESVIVGTRVTIYGIQEAELKHPYHCMVNNGDGSPEVAWSLQLKEKAEDRIETVLEGHWYAVIGVVVVSLSLITFTVFRLWGPQIHLWFSSKFCQITSKSKDAKNVGILHDMEDSLASTFISKTLESQLCEYGFTCSVIQHILPGKTILGEGYENLMSCDAVISILSKSTTKDGAFHYLMNCALVHKDIVFCILLHKDLTKEEIQESVKGVSERYGGVSILKWVTKPSKRLVKNFWSKVRLKLLDTPKKKVRSSPPSPVDSETFL